MILPALSLSGVREYMRSEEEGGWWQGTSRRMSAPPVSASKPPRVTDPLTHPLIPSMPQPNEPSASRWLLYTAAPSHRQYKSVLTTIYRPCTAALLFPGAVVMTCATRTVSLHPRRLSPSAKGESWLHLCRRNRWVVSSHCTWELHVQDTLV